MKILTALALVFVLTSCGNSDQVESQYATRAAAEADHLFDRGWLPSLIPSSSINIKIKTDLDLNLSNGEFSFDPVEAQAFIAALQPAAGTKTPWNLTEEIEQKMKDGYSVFTYTEEDSRWIFFVNPTKGHSYYDSWMLERTANHVVQPMR